jgi:hypothetical protein
MKGLDMARILKNKTAADVLITCGTVTIIVKPATQTDLSEYFADYQLSASESLITAIGMGVDNCQLNDGTNDLSASDAIDLIKGYVQKIPLDDEGRITIRNTTARNGTFHLRCFTFYTSDPTKLFNRKPDGSSYGDVNVKCYDAGGAEITSAPYSNAVRTVVDFEPTYTYEIIGGNLYLPADLKSGTTDQWFGSAIGVPDVPANMGGSIDYVCGINIEAADSPVDIDARATSRMVQDNNYHSNKIRLVLHHPTGVSKRFQMALEIYE